MCKICTRSSCFRSFSFHRSGAMFTRSSAISGAIPRHLLAPMTGSARQGLGQISGSEILRTAFTQTDRLGTDRSYLDLGTIDVRIAPGAPTRSFSMPSRLPANAAGPPFCGFKRNADFEPVRTLNPNQGRIGSPNGTSDILHKHHPRRLH